MDIRGEDENWFNNNVSCKLGVGSDIDFWRQSWLGAQPFQILFPNLFEYVSDSRHKVGSLEAWRDGTWSWNLEFNLAHLSMVASLE